MKTLLVRFVGRERELRELRTALEGAVAGQGRLVLLIGEAGIGKTRIAEELAAHARTLSARVLWGHCHEGERAPAYWPWVQVLRALVRSRETASLATELGWAAPEVARVVPELRTRLAGVAPAPAPTSEEERFRFFDAVASFVRAAAEREPLAVILEDFHWADEPSLLLLRFLARGLAGSRLLVVGTSRSRETAAARGLCEADLAAERIPLGGLGVPEIATLVADAAGHVPAPALVAALRDATEGNPFFVQAVVRLLAAENRLGAADLRAFPLPDEIRGAVRRRLDGLAPASRRLLALASVVGREFDARLLARVAERSVTDVLGMVGEAVAAGIAEPLDDGSGRYRFPHALVRETLYEDVELAERAGWHRAIGLALEHAGGADAHLNALAHHFLRAAHCGEAERAVEYAHRAGRQAMTVLAYEEAARHYEHALHGLDLLAADARKRCDLLVALGVARWCAGEAASAREALDEAVRAARSVPAPDALAEAALRLGQLRPETGEVDQALVGLLEEALAALTPGDSSLRVRLLARLAVALVFAPQAEARRAALSEEALGMARRLGDAATLSSALLPRHFVLWGPGSVTERLAIADEMLTLGDEAQDAYLAREAWAWRVLDLLELGDIAAVDEEIAAAARHPATLRVPRSAWHLALLRAMRALLAGRYEEAEQQAAAALAVPGAEQENALQFFAIQLFFVRQQQGRLAELAELFGQQAAGRPTLPVWRCGLALLLAELDRRDEAGAELDRLAASDFADLPRDMNFLPALAMLAQVCAYLHDARRARLLHALLRPFAARNIVIATSAACLGSAERHLGLLAETAGKLDDALAHLEAAAAMHDRMRAPPLVAETQYDLARVLLARGRRGDQARARELFAAAGRAAGQLGMGALASRVAAMASTATGRANRLSPLPREETAPDENVFRLDGDSWTIVYDGREVRIHDTKGMHHLARLLRHPGQELHVTELAAGGTAEAQPAAGGIAGGARPDLGDAGPLLDARAKAAYRSRLRELRGDLDEARRFNDTGRAERVGRELELLTGELARATGLGGRDRRASRHAERARVNVVRTVRAALERIVAAHPALGQHLSHTVRTGFFCSYSPDPRVPISWTV